jgi:hypothetical protein
VPRSGWGRRRASRSADRELVAGPHGDRRHQP